MKNHRLVYENMDDRYYRKATADIVEMLALLGVGEGREYIFPDRMPKSEFNVLKGIGYRKLGETRGVTVIDYDWAPAILWPWYPDGEMACRVAAYLRSTPGLSRYQRARFKDHTSDYEADCDRVENAAAADIISLLQEMGVKEGQPFALPAVRCPRNDADDILEIVYREGRDEYGDCYDIAGKQYTMSFLMELEMGAEPDYVVLRDARMIAYLYARVRNVYNKFMKKKEMQR